MTAVPPLTPTARAELAQAMEDYHRLARAETILSMLRVHADPTVGWASDQLNALTTEWRDALTARCRLPEATEQVIHDVVLAPGTRIKIDDTIAAGVPSSVRIDIVDSDSGWSGTAYPPRSQSMYTFTVSGEQGTKHHRMERGITLSKFTIAPGDELKIGLHLFRFLAPTRETTP